MRTVPSHLARVSKAPLADIQPLGRVTTEHVFGVEGRIPWLDVKVAEHDVCDIACHWRAVGCAIRREETRR